MMWRKKENLRDEFNPATFVDEDGRTMLHILAYKGLPSISVLVIAGADPNKKDKYGATPLHYAAWKGRLKAIDDLLKAGADPTARSNDGHTPADWARHGKHDDIAMLIDAIAKHPKTPPQAPDRPHF